MKIFQKVLLTSSLFALSSATFAETTNSFIKNKNKESSPIFEKPVFLAETPVSYVGFDTLKITVTGTRTERAIKDVPAAVSTFDYEQINEIAPLSWRDVFKYDASISSQDFSRSDGSRTYSTGDKGNINIRGVEGNRILTLIDGIPIPRFSYGRGGTYAASRLNYIDFSNIGNIEVLKGPGSSLYGSSAMGGVVSIRSLVPDDILEEGENNRFEISSPYNSQNNSYQPSVKYAFRDNDISGVFAYSFGKYEELNRNTDKKYINDKDGDLNSYYVKLIKSSGNTDYDLTIENIDKEATTIGTNYYATQTGLNAQKDFRESRRTRISVGANYEADQDQLIDKFSAKIYTNYMDNKSDYFTDSPFKPASGAPGSQPTPAQTDNTKVELNQEMIGANFQFTNDFNTKETDQKLTYGFEVNFNDASRIRKEFVNGVFGKAYKSNPDSDILKLGFYVQDEIRFKKWDIIAGLRYDANNIDAKDSQEWYDSLSISGLGIIDKETAVGKPISKDYNNWSPSISAIYKINNDVRFYGKYANSFRAPSWEDLNSSRISLTPGFSYTTVGNPDLKEETSNNYEIGLKGRNKKSDFGLATFLNKYKNFLDKSVNKGRTDTLPYTYRAFNGATKTVNAAKYQTVNIPDTTIWGIEADYKYHFTERNKGLSVSASASYVKGRDDTNDQNLDSVNPFTAITSFNYIFPNNKLSTSLITTYVGKPSTSDDYKNPTLNGRSIAANVYVPEAFITTDVVLKYKASNRFTADLGIYNIFDKTYYLWSDIRSNGVSGSEDVAYQRYAQPGTSIKAGFKWRF